MKCQRHFVLGVILVAIAAGVYESAWANDYAEVPAVVREDYFALDSEPQRHSIGALLRVQAAAEEMLIPERASVWGFSGRLSPEDLTNDFITVSDEGIAGFNVLDAEGFVDGYKCNLFVFELAYRSGLLIPMTARLRGWGYPGPEEVLRDIERDHFHGGWATLADHLTLEELWEAHEQGIAFALVGEGANDRAGHMGMVDEIHWIRHDDDGNIIRVEYSGWEANGDGAHYRRRTWGLTRYDAIHMLELRQPEPGHDQCYASGVAPRWPSLLDAPRLQVMLAQRAAEGGPSPVEVPIDGEPTDRQVVSNGSTSDEAPCSISPTASLVDFETIEGWSATDSEPAPDPVCIFDDSEDEEPAETPVGSSRPNNVSAAP